MRWSSVRFRYLLVEALMSTGLNNVCKKQFQSFESSRHSHVRLVIHMIWLADEIHKLNKHKVRTTFCGQIKQIPYLISLRQAKFDS